jgi:short-subunit dehydrogenase
VAVPGRAPYCVTKSAVVALSESLHHDLGANAGGKVKVSVLCPAWVKTKISESERNRPASARNASSVGARPNAGEREVADAVRAAVASGIPPEVVAEKVLHAIAHDRFWIITHSKTKKMIEKRMRGILDDVNPEFDPFGA